MLSKLSRKALYEATFVTLSVSVCTFMSADFPALLWPTFSLIFALRATSDLAILLKSKQKPALNAQSA